MSPAMRTIAGDGGLSRWPCGMLRWHKVDHHSSPLTSTWQYPRCDVGLEEGDYTIVLCTIIMVHKGTSSYCRLID